MRRFLSTLVLSTLGLILVSGQASAQAAKNDELEGVWGSHCQPEGEKWKNYGVFVRGKELKISGTIFEDGECETKPYRSSKIVYTYSIEENMPYNHLNLKVTAVALSLHHVNDVKFFNDNNICGGGWVLNQWHDHSDKTCAGKDVVKLGTNFYTLYHRDPEIYRIYLGDKPSTSENERPTKLSGDALDGQVSE